MAPLELETYNSESKSWIKVGEIKPGDRPGSVSDNKPDGRRDVYLFECAADDSKTTLYRSIGGADLDLSSSERGLIPISGLETVKELQKGETYTLTIKTDRSPQLRQFRLSHK
jgi:hypothetical protein